MSWFPPSPAGGLEPERDHTTLRQRPLHIDERRARWLVRAAQWRARELAEMAFGSVSDTALIGLRTDGPMRGVLRMDVPFSTLEDHQRRESVFHASIQNDAVLAEVPLIYILGPDAA